jgi:type I restriction enzyme S subunit
VGESVELVKIGKSKIIGGLHTIVLRDKREGITCVGFKGHFFNNSEFLNVLRRVATGTSVYSISKSTLSSVKINLPPIREQKLITKILDAADQEHEIHKKNLTILTQQKKGLMQLLLTGKKRLVQPNRTRNGKKSKGLFQSP